MVEGVEYNGWNIYSLVSPTAVSDNHQHAYRYIKTVVFIQVKKEIVDSFDPKDKPRPPSLQLRAEALNQEVRKFRYPLSLKGTNEPEAKFLLDPTEIRGINISCMCMY